MHWGYFICLLVLSTWVVFSYHCCLDRRAGLFHFYYSFSILSLFFFNKKTELGFSCTCKTSGTTPQSRAIENMPNTSRLGNSKSLPVSLWQEECLSASANVSEEDCLIPIACVHMKHLCCQLCRKRPWHFAENHIPPPPEYQQKAEKPGRSENVRIGCSLQQELTLKWKRQCWNEPGPSYGASSTKELTSRFPRPLSTAGISQSPSGEPREEVFWKGGNWGFAILTRINKKWTFSTHTVLSWQHYVPRAPGEINCNPLSALTLR